MSNEVGKNGVLFQFSFGFADFLFLFSFVFVEDNLERYILGERIGDCGENL